MNTVSTDPVVVDQTASVATGLQRGRRGFWALIATQFQGAFSDNILRNLLLSMIIGMNLAKSERRRLFLLSRFCSRCRFSFSACRAAGWQTASASARSPSGQR